MKIAGFLSYMLVLNEVEKEGVQLCQNSNKNNGQKME